MLKLLTGSSKTFAETGKKAIQVYFEFFSFKVVVVCFLLQK